MQNADDIIIASSQSTYAKELIVKLGLAFHLRDLGPPKFFLEIEIEIARSVKGITLKQRKYVLDLFEASGFSGCKPSSIPMEPNPNMFKEYGIVFDD